MQVAEIRGVTLVTAGHQQPAYRPPWQPQHSIDAGARARKAQRRRRWRSGG
jgi:hypothetical protein